MLCLAVAAVFLSMVVSGVLGVFAQISTPMIDTVADDDVVDDVEAESDVTITGTGPFSLQALTLSVTDSDATILTLSTDPEVVIDVNTKLSDNTPGISLSNYDSLGASVALDGDRIIVGATDNDSDGVINGGAAYVLEDKNGDGRYDGDGENIKIDSATSGISLSNYDGFGTSVAAKGNHIIVGAAGDDTGGTDRGAVYILEDMNDDGDYADPGENIKISSDTSGISLSNFNYFGISAAVDGDRIIVGATGDDTGGTDRGAVYVLEDMNDDGDYADSGENIKISSDTPGISLSNFDYFGTSVAVEGNHIIVGAAGDDTGGASGANRGAVYVLEDANDDGRYDGDGENIKISSDTPGISLSDYDSLGTSVAAEGNHIIVGAAGDDTGGVSGTNRGAVYILGDVNGDGDYADPGENIKIDNTTPGISLSTYDGFGISVAAEGNHIIVGVAGDGTGGTDRGAVYDLTVQGSFTATMTPTEVQSLRGGEVTITAEGTDTSGDTGTTTHTFIRDTAAGSAGFITVINDDTTVERDKEITPIVAFDASQQRWAFIDPDGSDDIVGTTDDEACDATTVFQSHDTFDSMVTFLITDESSNGEALCFRAFYNGKYYYRASDVIQGIDGTAPNLASVPTLTTTGTEGYAKAGDTLTLTFTVSEELQSTPTVTLAGENATVSNTGTTYTAITTVTSTTTEGAVTYDIGTLIDTASNSYDPAVMSHTIIVDRTAPVITLTGSASVTLDAGDTYTEEGATADTGETVTVTGTVDTDTPGDYTITYTATDAAGNTGTASRTVTINAPSPTPHRSRQYRKALWLFNHSHFRYGLPGFLLSTAVHPLPVTKGRMPL